MRAGVRSFGGLRAGLWVRLALSALLALVLAEVALRFALPAPHSQSPRLHEMLPSGRTYGLSPGLDLSMRMRGQEISIHTNALGLRGPPAQQAKPAGKQRVCFLGDSFTFGLWASADEFTFVGRAAELLSDLPVELLNCGVSGHGFLDERIYLEEKVLDLEPDRIVLVAYTGNDFRESYLGPRAHRAVNGVITPVVEVYRERLPPEWFLVPYVPIEAQPPWSSERSGLVSGWKRLSRRLFPRPARTPEADRIDMDFPIDPSFFGSACWSLDDPPEIVEQAIAMGLEDFAELGELCERLELPFCVVVLPSRLQIYATNERGEGFDISTPERELEAICAEHGWPELDLLAALRAGVRATEEDFFYPGDTHFTDLGHRVVGREIAAFLRPMLADRPR